MATDLERLVVQLSADIKSYDREMARARGTANREARAIENRFRSMNRNLDGIGRRAARSLIGPLMGIGAALSVREVLRYADAWTSAKNSLAVAGVIGANQADVLERLYDSAQANAAPISALADLFGKAAQASDNLGASQEELLKFSAGVATSLRVAGSSASQSSGGALTQLGQLLGQARVQAEEFNSINEGARPILMAVAHGLDEASGSVSKLKQMVTDGKVSGQQFFQAFLRGLPQIEGMAANATQTIDQGMTKVNNAFTRYIGETDASLDASQRLVAGLNALADNFDQVADTTIKLVSVLAGALLGRAIGGMIAALPAAATAVMALVTALRAGAVAGATFSAAMGPIGLIAGAAAAALYLLHDAQTDAEKAADTHEAALRVLESEILNVDLANADAVASTRAKIAADIDATKVALTRAQAERDLQAAILRDEVSPPYSLLPAPLAHPLDVQNTIDNNPMVKDREALIQTITDQIDELERLQTEFEGFVRDPSTRTTVRTRSGVDVNDPPGSGRGKGKGGSRADEFAREVEQITKRTAATQAATAAQEKLNPLIEDYGYAATKAAAAYDLIVAAQEAGITMTAEVAAKIEELSEAYAQATAEAGRLDEAQDNIRQSAEEMTAVRQEVMGGFIKDMAAGESAANALANALGKVGDKLLDMALDNLFSGGTGRSGGLLGGAIIPGILHGGGIAGRDGYGHGRRVSPAVFAGAQRYHEGGIAGLRPGEVPAILQRGELVIPRGGMKQAQGVRVHVTTGVSVDASGNLLPFVQNVAVTNARAVMGAEMDGFRAGFGQNVHQAVTDPRKRAAR